MRLDTTLVNLALFVSLSSSTSSTTAQQHERHSAYQRHVSRSKRLIQDLGVSLSSLLLYPRGRPLAPAPSHQRRTIVRRGGVNAAHQCVLKSPKGPFGDAVSDGGGGGSSSTTIGGKPGSSSVKGGTTGKATSTSSSSSTKAPSKTTDAGAGPSPTPTPSPSSPYKIVLDSSGGDMFGSDWLFWSDGDPTHGTVQYTTKQQAQDADLIEVNDQGHAILRVETTPQIAPGANRKSVRIETTTTHTGGLWVLDAVHMPVGCGTWPAWWTHGPNWPSNGEIDILEGVNDNAFNQAALHTAVGCTLDTADFASVTTGTSLSPVCAADLTGNTGCGIKANDVKSYGTGFNKNQGGVYAMLWDDGGVSIYFFPRGSIPKDLTSETPQPQNWGLPAAKFPASTCAPFQYNKDHKTIINTTLCGDWAGGTWAAAQNDGSPSCAQKTGFADCPSYVASQGGQFSEAFWQIKSMKIYQLK